MCHFFLLKMIKNFLKIDGIFIEINVQISILEFFQKCGFAFFFTSFSLTLDSKRKRFFLFSQNMYRHYRKEKNEKNENAKA